MRKTTAFLSPAGAPFFFVLTMCFHYLGIVAWHRFRRFAQALLAVIADYAGKSACTKMRCL
jgi:hypothetical protein